MIRKFGLCWMLALLLVVGRTSLALAWNDTGHRLVAAIAWDDLTAAARAKFTQILKQHPRYKEDLLADLPVDATSDDLDRYAFEMAATWPDVVRSLSNPMHAAYNHPNWHYIDIPYCLGGQAPHLPPTTGPSPGNILQALTFSVTALRDSTTSAPNQALALCWVLHLCGDVHQPLHTVSLFSPRFPNGDQGGNAIQVLRQPPYPDSRINLHSLWDQLPGVYKNEATIRDLAAGLRADPRYSRQMLKDSLNVTDPAAWANESHDLAVKFAYLNGELSGIATAPTGGAQQVPGLPAGYVTQAEGIAMSRIVLAGYRTADLLNGMSGGN